MDYATLDSQYVTYKKYCQAVIIILSLTKKENHFELQMYIQCDTLYPTVDNRLS